MSKTISIIMYHYVRELTYSRYPNIKGLDYQFFKEQILYLKKHYNFITVENLIDAAYNNAGLPSKALLLTFDDGYIDHFTYVFPILSENKIQGAFFPPAKAIVENSILDVNKIHFILASTDDKNSIIKEILKKMDTYRELYDLKPNDWYINKLSVANRFDSAQVIFIKRLLQVELNEDLRKIITDYLFKKFVNVDERVFSKELYMNVDQLKCMYENGMHIGSHSYDHYWLGSLSKEDQKSQIQLSLNFLNKVGVNKNYYTICYPYGSYNEDTIDILKTLNVKAGFTTKVDVATLTTKQSVFQLPRLDTNDIPQDCNASVNNWFNIA